jgi:nicotinate-nucleotide pyrophosphorylase (carboxylating)
MPLGGPAPGEVETLVRRALAEDHGAGDITSLALVPAHLRACAEILARADGVIAGTEAALCAFRVLDPDVSLALHSSDGAHVARGDRVLAVHGFARAVVGAERVALNFLQHLSGIATLTRRFVDAVAGTNVRILDTRKTTPCLRTLEKAAVRAGGGQNHRFGLFDMVLIKENHIRLAGSIAQAVAHARHTAPELTIEVETTTADEALEALRAGADRIMLDNVSLDALRERVKMIRQQAATMKRSCPKIEASGGVTLNTVRRIAETGVDDISVGALTHSAPALDLSLLVREVR